MRSPRRHLPFATLLAALALAGCDRGTEPAPATTGPVGGIESSREEIPRDSLYGATAPEIVRIVPAEVEVRDVPQGWDSVRIAVLSDFQLGLWPDNQAVAEAAVRRAASSGAELFVLLGDYVAEGEHLNALERILAPLRGRPVFAVLGDRDAPGDSLEAGTAQSLSALGVTVLQNDRAPLVRGDDTIFVAGLTPEFALLPDWRQAEVAAALAGPATPVLLTHSPAVAARIPAERFPLILAGNTFCGSVDVPGTPRLASLATDVFPSAQVAGADRVFRVNGNHLFVTCGLGYSFVPVRLGAPPEILLVTLRRAATPEPDQAGTGRADSLLLQSPPPDTAQASGP